VSQCQFAKCGTFSTQGAVDQQLVVIHHKPPQGPIKKTTSGETPGLTLAAVNDQKYSKHATIDPTARVTIVVIPVL
jgi:hypothetical protein